MDKRFASFNVRARYYVLGNLGAKTTKIWYVLHGQGQLAFYFAKKFESLVNDHTCIIVPEGLSRYYTEGVYGRVGASWMTKEERLLDIENYLAYLNTCYKEIGNDFEETTVLGFSQGAATASRWVMQTPVQPSRLILWSGIFPPDLPFEKGQEQLAKTKVFQVYGTEDPYLSDEKFTEQESIQRRLGVDVEVISFDGGHDIHQHTLMTFA